MNDLEAKIIAEQDAKRADFRKFKGIEREVVFEYGARFFRDPKTDKVMFAYRSSANAEFTRVAKAEDAQAYPSQWKQFNIHEKGPPKVHRGWPKGKPRK